MGVIVAVAVAAAADVGSGADGAVIEGAICVVGAGLGPGWLAILCKCGAKSINNLPNLSNNGLSSPDDWRSKELIVSRSTISESLLVKF